MLQSDTSYQGVSRVDITVVLLRIENGQPPKFLYCAVDYFDLWYIKEKGGS